MSSRSEGNFGRTIGEIAAVHHVYGGTVLAMFPANPDYVRVPVHEGDLTEAGIEVKPGIQFSAEVNLAATDSGDLCPRGFAAIEQLDLNGHAG
jgi:hypothetical protein